MGDFDFLVGSWKVTHRRLAQRLTGHTDWVESTATARCWNVFDGMGNVDEIRIPGRPTGMSVRIYDETTKQWSIHWAVAGSGLLGPPVVGSFTDGRGEFTGEDTHDGRPIRVRFIWSDITEKSARWEQAFSMDDGVTWEVNWVMSFTRD